MATRIIDTENKILVGDNHPQLKIGNKCYIVDDRQKTWEKMGDVLTGKTKCKDQDYEFVKLAIGKEGADEVLKDITVSGMENLTYFIIAAIRDLSFEEAKEFVNGKN